MTLSDFMFQIFFISFSVVFFQRSGKELPQVLTPEMIPPASSNVGCSIKVYRSGIFLLVLCQFHYFSTISPILLEIMLYITYNIYSFYLVIARKTWNILILSVRAFLEGCYFCLSLVITLRLQIFVGKKIFVELIFAI